MKNTNENYKEMENFIAELGSIENAVERQHQEDNIKESIYGLKEANLLTAEEVKELLAKF